MVLRMHNSAHDQLEPTSDTNVPIQLVVVNDQCSKHRVTQLCIAGQSGRNADAIQSYGSYMELHIMTPCMIYQLSNSRLTTTYHATISANSNHFHLSLSEVHWQEAGVTCIIET